MSMTWINGSLSRFDGGFMTLRARRGAGGSVRLNLYFSAAAVKRLGLRRGERLLVGVDENAQKLAFKPTLFGGNSLRGRDGSSHLECDVTMPIFNLPQPQLVDEADLCEDGDAISVPFKFDAAEFRGWKRDLLPAALRAA